MLGPCCCTVGPGHENVLWPSGPSIWMVKHCQLMLPPDGRPALSVHALQGA